MLGAGAPYCLGASFNVSNTLGDGMVLQRAPKSAIVWGFGEPDVTVTTTFLNHAYTARVGADGVWRQALPPTPARTQPTTIAFTDGNGTQASLADVLFGDVFLCSGQSNMQYTPRSMAGMNNMSAEIAAADAYGDTVRFFTVGMDTACGDPAKNQTDCSQPFRQLNPHVPAPGAPCRGGASCREPWSRASAAALGGDPAWNTFSAVCWLMGRRVHDALGGAVPIGLVSSNWGGTPVQSWQPLASTRDCGDPGATKGGALYNSMVAPFTVGPMQLTGISWYQGESNVGGAAYYACAFPSMIRRWRAAFGDADEATPSIWFGFVQIAGYRYSVPYGNPPRPELDHSHHAGDLRQAQLAALALPLVGLGTAADAGDWTNIHPPDKQYPSLRLANQLLVQQYGEGVGGASRATAGFPLFAGSSVAVVGGTVTVTVAVRGQLTGQAVRLSTAAPPAATQSSTLNASASVPRNRCITDNPAFGLTFPEDCGYPTIYGMNGTSGAVVLLNASAAVGADGSSIVLTASVPPGANFTATASSYGRGSWPRTAFFAAAGQGRDRLPLLPWYANFSTTDPAAPPAWLADQRERLQAHLQPAAMASHRR
eukprot:g6352.t1